MASRKKQADEPTLVGIRGEVTRVDPLDMTFAELDEVRRLIGLLPNAGDLRYVDTAAYAFVILKRDGREWDDSVFLGLKPNDVDLDPPKGSDPGEA